jgi:hypothetical protein
VAATDRLMAYRQKRGGMPPMDEGAEEEGMPKEKPSDRSVMLTDMEKKALSGSYQPGEQVTCEVTGRLDGDGKFDIIEIKPSGGPVDANAGMPIRTNPAIAPS